MIQKTWLKSTDPRKMLAHLGHAASDRKLQLFACACCRRAWGFVKDKRLEPILLLLEGIADKTVKAARRESLQDRSYKLTNAKIDDSQQCIAWEMWGALRESFTRDDNDLGESAAAAFGYAAGKRDDEFFPAKGAERKRQADVVREIFGNPFRKVTFDKKWRTDTVMTLAKQMYAAHEFSAAPILADALQDAGCDSDDLLNHLRDTALASAKPHTGSAKPPAVAHHRGCWALDLVLGKK